MKIYLFLLLLVLIPLTSAQISTLTQAQIDNLNPDTLFNYVLSTCDTDGLVHLEDTYLMTYYTCYRVEPIEEGVLYGVYEREFFTVQDAEPYLNVCGNEITLQQCEEHYWNQVIEQAFRQINAIAREIENYQTDNQNPFNWIRDFFT